MKHFFSYSTTSFNKTLFVFSFLFIFCASVFAQTPAKWSVNGNTATSGDFLGTTNNEELVFKTNNTTAFKIKANGNIVLKSLEGSGNGLVTIDNDGKVVHVPYTGDVNQVLLGNGTFGTLSGISWSDAGSGKIYYNGGKVGIGTATPNFKLDVDGDVRITQNMYLQGELIISDKIQTPKQMRAGSIVVDSLLMDSTKAVYGITNFKDEVKLGNKLSVYGAATIGGPLKVLGGLILTPIGPISENPCFNLVAVDPVTGLANPVDATAIEAAFDLSGAGVEPCPTTAIPFTWGTYGNHVTNDARWIGTVENFDFRIKTFSTLRMIVKKDGKVGIGTATPQSDLDVNGNIQISGDRLHVGLDGNVGIGTNLSSNPNNYKLAVNGMIGAKEVKIEVNSSTWPDFVFEADYKRMTILEKEAFYMKEKHLPYIDSRKEIGENGLKMGTVLSGMTQNIEENTMDIAELYKKIVALEKENQNLKKQIEGLGK